MPRVEIIPPNWEGSEDQRMGNGTPTVDVCRACAAHFHEGDPAQDCGIAGTVGVTDEEHPTFDDPGFGVTYCCEVCGCPLTVDDE